MSLIFVCENRVLRNFVVHHHVIEIPILYSSIWRVSPIFAQTHGCLDFRAAKVVSVPTGLLASGFTQVAHG